MATRGLSLSATQIGKSNDVYRSAKEWRHHAFSFIVVGVVAALLAGVALHFFLE
jgi:hypothetical protein